MGSKIDLQIHTTHSDGRDTPKEILQLAFENSVGIISITDHDVVSGAGEAIQEAKPFGITVIPGVETRAGFKGEHLHILGYNIDIHNRVLAFFLQNISELRKRYYLEQFDSLNKKLKSAGKKMADSHKYSRKGSKYFTLPGLSLFLFEEGIAASQDEGFSYVKDIKIPALPIQPKETFDIIHTAGGVAVLSHPFAPHLSLRDITSSLQDDKEIIRLFKEQGLDGLECYQAAHSSEDTAYALQLAEKFQLGITGGSDWHGLLDKLSGDIKVYIPFYIKKFGDLEIPEISKQKIIDFLGIR